MNGQVGKTVVIGVTVAAGGAAADADSVGV
jgi:hypothetical protein